MDISELNLTDKSDQPKPVDIYHPITGEKTDIVISIVGRESTQARRFGRKVRQDMFQRAQQYWKQGKEVPSLSDDEEDTLDARQLAAIITGWDGIEKDGQPYPYNPDNALELMRTYPWMARQIDKAHKDDELFFGSKPAA